MQQEPCWLVTARLSATTCSRLAVSPEQQPFVAVTAQRAENNSTIFLPDGSSVEVPSAALDAANPELQDDLDDIGKLSHLNEACLFHLIATRYLVGRHIYTSAGPVLVALNPFTPQPALYSTSKLEAYQRHSAAADGSSAEPHVFALAATAFQGLVSRGVSQSIAINGESGAGKVCEPGRESASLD